MRVEQFRTTETVHGLYEIRETAANFISGYNKRKRENWQVGEPNLKVLVPRCLVPLKAEWLPKSYGRTGDNVVVSCARSIDKAELRTWQVFVPVRSSEK